MVKREFLHVGFYSAGKSRTAAIHNRIHIESDYSVAREKCRTRPASLVCESFGTRH